MLRTVTNRFWLLSFLALGAARPAICALPLARVPIVLDTDIGTDVDDAFALAMIVQSKGLELKAVTTVSGNTQARARVVAKMLGAAGLGDVPVAAGSSAEETLPAQVHWADGFTSASLVTESAVDLLKQAIDREQGRMVIIAIGALTNIAALLQQHPEVKGHIQEIVLMGGSLRHGYTEGSGQTRESNIASDIDAARTVLSSGIRIRMAPLDVTAQLQMNQERLAVLFAHHTPITESLHALYLLWGQPVPTLHDPMAVSLLTNPSLCRTKVFEIEVNDNGLTKPQLRGAPNATVAVETDPARFIRYYEALFAH